MNAVCNLYASAVLFATLTYDQNEDSGNWVELGKYSIPANIPITVEITKSAHPVGDVLRADAIRLDRISDFTEIAAIQPEFRLLGNYPNPFNPQTNIHFTIPTADFVTVAVYNLLGQEVLRREQFYESGYHFMNIDMGHFSSGIYLYQIRQAENMKSGKLLLIK